METWNLIRGLYETNTYPWCLIGDMNNVLSQDDKKGGRPYPSWLIQGFRDVLNDCNMIDMDLCGYQFTWERGIGTDDHIEVRLDRAIISPGFQNLFPDAKLINLEITTSDHCPLLLELDKNDYVQREKPFRFENAWLKEPICQQIVQEVWNSHSELSLYEKLTHRANILS